MTALLQLLVVAVSGSVALLADTIHNFSDALTAVPLWIAFVVGRRPATRRYTYGYGRAEDLAGVFIVAMIAMLAVVAGYESIRRLVDPQPIANIGWVLIAGVIGFAGNELVAVYRVRVGRKIGSAALVADGLHARTDGFTSLAVVAGALGVLAGFPSPTRSSDCSSPPPSSSSSRAPPPTSTAGSWTPSNPSSSTPQNPRCGTCPASTAWTACGLRWIRHQLRAETDLTVDCQLTVVEAHAIADDAQHRLLHGVPRLHDATVHINPRPHDETDHHQATAHHRSPATRTARGTVAPGHMVRSPTQQQAARRA